LPNRYHWTLADMPDQSGRVAIVTGANSGIGYATARALAQKGGLVIMACRNLEKANAAAEKIRAELQQAPAAGKVTVMPLDLADLDSVEAFAVDFKAQYDRLDLLINNAGIMRPPYQLTRQGFESQIGVNHLGHFALTGRLLDRMLRTASARVVTVSSLLERFGRINFDDLQARKGYQASIAYSQSKLANLLFTYELQRRLEAAGSDVIAVAAHPGWAATQLQKSALIQFFNRFLAQRPEMGALPTLYAATAPGIQGGDYIGPAGFMALRGLPKKVNASGRAYDPAVAARLWAVSEELTGVRSPIQEKPDVFCRS
jgi:NAD(P)-dependent dehydrogenase (short-subunit alcohol dehydrogenase family)